MSLAGDLISQGLGLLREIQGEVTGTLRQLGTDYPFTGGRILERRREPRTDRRDVQELDLELVAAGVTVEPLVGSAIQTAADGTWWRILRVVPSQAGEVVAWKMALEQQSDRESAAAE